jgi:hypothetical protein
MALAKPAMAASAETANAFMVTMELRFFARRSRLFFFGTTTSTPPQSFD